MDKGLQAGFSWNSANGVAILLVVAGLTWRGSEHYFVVLSCHFLGD